MSDDLFPACLRKLREAKKLSGRTLSELCGLSDNMIARYESGDREPSIQTLKVIADFFQVSLDYLVGREE